MGKTERDIEKNLREKLAETGRCYIIPKVEASQVKVPDILVTFGLFGECLPLAIELKQELPSAKDTHFFFQLKELIKMAKFGWYACVLTRSEVKQFIEVLKRCEMLKDLENGQEVDEIIYEFINKKYSDTIDLFSKYRKIRLKEHKETYYQ